MFNSVSTEIAALEVGYLNHLHHVNELDRLETAFDRIIRELDEMKAKLNAN